jgi:hypothetical protein
LAPGAGGAAEPMVDTMTTAATAAARRGMAQG